MMMKNFEDMFSHFDTNMTDGHCMMAYVMLMHSMHHATKKLFKNVICQIMQ